MLEWKLLSCLMFPKIVARALRSLILVFDWSSARTYFSSGVQSSHFHVYSYGTTAIGVAAGCCGIKNAASVSRIIGEIIFPVITPKDIGIIKRRSPIRQGCCEDIVKKELTCFFIVGSTFGLMD